MANNYTTVTPHPIESMSDTMPMQTTHPIDKMSDMLPPGTLPDAEPCPGVQTIPPVDPVGPSKY